MDTCSGARPVNRAGSSSWSREPCTAANKGSAEGIGHIQINNIRLYRVYMIVEISVTYAGDTYT